MFKYLFWNWVKNSFCIGSICICSIWVIFKIRLGFVIELNLFFLFCRRKKKDKEYGVFRGIDF